MKLSEPSFLAPGPESLGRIYPRALGWAPLAVQLTTLCVAGGTWKEEMSVCAGGGGSPLH